MINNITDLRINTVLLEASTENSNASVDNTVYISTSLNVKNTKKSIRKYNLRLCVSLTPESSRALDFLSQRYNEFLKGRAGSISEVQFNDFLKTALGEHSQYLSNNQPFSPFSTNLESRNLVITDGLSQYGDGNSIPKDVIIYDMPLANMIDTLQIDKNILNTIKISLPPTNDSIDQISCYAFIYDNKMAQTFSEEASSNYSLFTGMGHVARGSFRGIQTEYAETLPDKPLVPMANPQQTTSPDQQSFRTINIATDSAVAKTYNNVFNGVVAMFQTPNISQSYELNKVIKRSNYFTDFWLSRDTDDNNRFVFSFDLQGFLADHALYPFVYQSSIFSRALINGGEELSPAELSSVLTTEVMRHKVSSHGSYPINDLGTIGKGYPDRDSLPIPTEDIKRVKINIPSNDPASLSQRSDMFFEGCDKFSKPQIIDQQISESYQYSANLSIVDHSPHFLRHLVAILNGKKRILSTIRDTISLSSSSMFGRKPLLNIRTGKTTRDIRSVQVIIDNKPVQVGEEIIKMLTLYEEILSGMPGGSFNIDLVSYYNNLLDKDQGIVNLQLITDIEMLFDLGISFLYTELVNLFPSDPLGVMDSIAKNDFNKNMSRSVRSNILRVENRFRDTYVTGKDNNLGVDYVFGEDTPTGFSNITVDSYDNRRIMEFNKYFFNPEAGDVIIPVGNYENLSYSYLTPRLIKTPSRPIIDQARASTSTTKAIEYDFDRYSQLYSDLVSIKRQKDLGVTYPTLSTIALEQSKNNQLYSDVRRTLLEEMSVSLSENPTAEFSPPRVVVSKTQVTTYNPKDKDRCGVNTGPDLIGGILGNSAILTSSAGLYLDSVNLEIKNQSTQFLTGNIAQENTKEALKDRSVKVPFIILGELTTNNTLSQLNRDIKSRFNSMKALPQILKIANTNLEESVQGPVVSSLPPQLQSMIILASTAAPLSINASAGLQVLDARRFILNTMTNPKGENLVSFFQINQAPDGIDNNSYGLTPDPMNSYDTFLALWMNYRQIAVVEYLNRFGNVEQPDQQLQSELNRIKPKLAEWSTLSADIAAELKSQGGKILCRVRNLGADDYLSMVRQFITPDQQNMLSEYFEEKQLIDLPTYNKYFYISNDTPQVDEVVIEETDMDNSQTDSATTEQQSSVGY
jgi:hypothetical protein